MKPRLQLMVLSLSLFVIVAGLYTFNHWNEWFEKRTQRSVDSESPDMIALSITQVTYNEAGEKHYQLAADALLQYLKSDRNVITRPDILFFDKAVPTWKTTANQATSDTNGEQLYFSGNVIIERKNSDQGATLHTDTLTLYPNREFATTEDKVIIRQKGISIEATGLDADLHNNKLTLHKQVTSIYEPEDS